MQQVGVGIKTFDPAPNGSARQGDSWRPVFLTVTEAARTISQSRSAVLRQIHSGQLRSLRLGRTYRIPDQRAQLILADGSWDDMYLTTAEQSGQLSPDQQKLLDSFRFASTNCH